MRSSPRQPLLATSYGPSMSTAQGFGSRRETTERGRISGFPLSFYPKYVLPLPILLDDVFFHCAGRKMGLGSDMHGLSETISQRQQDLVDVAVDGVEHEEVAGGGDLDGVWLKALVWFC